MLFLCLCSSPKKKDENDASPVMESPEVKLLSPPKKPRFRGKLPLARSPPDAQTEGVASPEVKVVNPASQLTSPDPSVQALGTHAPIVAPISLENFYNDSLFLGGLKVTMLEKKLNVNKPPVFPMEPPSVVDATFFEKATRARSS